MGATMKEGIKKIFRRATLTTICLFLFVSTAASAEVELSLTQEEKAYIAKKSIIKAASVDGAAPISFTDADGEIQGISKRVMDEISDMIGLVFEYKLYDTVDKVINSDADIIYGISEEYAPDNMKLSQPFLKSETILYINKSLEPDELDDRIYAAIKGSALPEGIKEENSIYFDTREQSLNAVENGKADYGYGNAYSVAFYTLQNGYKNIITIPKGKESREYCIGLLNGDEVLLSIINKSISSIEDSELQTLILDVSSRIDRKITFAMIMDAYGKQIFAAIFMIISILLISVISNIQANSELRIQNRKYEVLSHISNEYLYEYDEKTNLLSLSEKCYELFETEEALNEATRMLKDILADYKTNGQNHIIRLPLGSGKMGVFKAINSRIYDKQGRTETTIGKLIDISEETVEKEELLAKSQLDGLTGLYNAETTKELIVERMKNKDNKKIDAFILIDCDDFKDINDSLGHLAGNQMLEHIGESLRGSFRNTDVMGRVGGDEFCVYIEDIPSVGFVQQKCQQLITLISETNEGFKATVTIGIALVHGKDTYENVFKKADNALYQGKRNGKVQVVIYR